MRRNKGVFTFAIFYLFQNAGRDHRVDIFLTHRRSTPLEQKRKMSFTFGREPAYANDEEPIEYPALARVNRALRQRLFLLSRRDRVFGVLGSTGDHTYTITLGSTSTCTCPDYRQNGTPKCKHILFVLLRVLGLPQNFAMKTRYEDAELYRFDTGSQRSNNDLVDVAPPVSNVSAVQLTQPRVAPQEAVPAVSEEQRQPSLQRTDRSALIFFARNHVKLSPVEGVKIPQAEVRRKVWVDGTTCAICFEEVRNWAEKDSEPVWFCHIQCGENFHLSCISKWISIKVAKKWPCPFCRATYN